MQRVEINNPNEDWLGTKYFIDGKEVQNVKCVEFRVGVDEIPKFAFITDGIPDIDVMADVMICPLPRNIQESCKIITRELQKKEDFYDAFVASVQSVLSPKEKYVGDGCFSIELFDSDSHALAEEIVKRISGEK